MFRVCRCFSLFALLWLLIGCTPAPEDRVTVLQGAAMGTSYSIQAVDPPSAIAPAALRDRIETELERIEDRMSTYRDDSELSGFNRSRTTDWFPVSPELAGLVREAIRISEMSDGAFDPTVGPLVNLWGFGPGDDGTHAPPTDAEITQAKARVGYRKLSVRLDPPALRKSEPALYLDLSAIAKGYGVDRLADLCDAMGIADYLIEIGGELRGRGHNGQGLPWRIAVERPDPGRRAVHRILALDNGALATSGDYRNFFEHENTRYSHAIDPVTGRPVTHGLASVTVLAPRAAQADALATAFLVLGPRAGFTLAESLDTPALFIVRTPEGYSERQTSALADHLHSNPNADRNARG
ncbi:MAG: FAD:protein FMN transferase [Candidatus Thiosymbion ectosymbiont of Robbea hypermnestra]|nr:FAD:protein FMN transferase [Candidatus Thiosymbion ectosymbiont of Robbea hypermnestra]